MSGAPDLSPLYPEPCPLSTPAFYGMARSELAHNGVLHTLLSDPDCGAACLRAIIEHATWPDGAAPTGGLKAARYQSSGGGRTRVDEYLELDDGSALLIEMKVDSFGGARQLASYMHAVRHPAKKTKAFWPPPDPVHGLLLRLTSVPDPAPDADLGQRMGRMDLARWCDALTAMVPAVDASRRIAPEHFAEYRRLCDRLRAQEEVILAHPDAVLALAGKKPTLPWWQANGRWCLGVIAGALAARLASTHEPVASTTGDFAWLGPKLGGDSKSRFVDCAVGLGRSFFTESRQPVAAYDDGAVAATSFLKVRVGREGVVAEVHVIVADYLPASKRRPEQRAAMSALAGRIRAVAPTAAADKRTPQWGPSKALAASYWSGAVLSCPIHLSNGIDGAAETIAARMGELIAALETEERA